MVRGDQKEVSSPLFMTDGSVTSKCTKTSHTLSMTKATKSGGPILEGGPGQGTSAHRACQHTAAPADSRCHPCRCFLVISVDSWLPTRPLFPLVRPGVPGSRRPRCSLHIELRVGSSHEKVGEKQAVDPSLLGKDMSVKE